MADQKKMPSQFSAYKKTEVMTANRETILLMMYEGAQRFLRQAVEAQAAHNPPECTRLVGRTQEIINELRATLNFDADRAVAENLEKLYAYLSQRLMQGLADQDVTHFEEVLKVLGTLHEAWDQAISALRKERATAQEK